MAAGGVHSSMRIHHSGLPTLALVLLATAEPALAADAVDIILNNDTSDSLRITLFDLNAAPAQRVIVGDVINAHRQFAEANSRRVVMLIIESGQSQIPRRRRQFRPPE